MVEKPATHMRDSDAFSWYMERDPLLRSTVVTVLLFDRSPDLNLILEKAERASRTVPGLRHKLVETPLRMAPPRWTVDPDFDLSWHVRRIEAPPPKNFASVLDLARIAGMSGFDPARPMWEWTVVDGLVGGQAAVVLKFHHSLTDGIGGMQLATTLFDLGPEPSDLGPMPDAPAAELLSLPGVVTDAILYNGRRLLDFAKTHAATSIGDARHAVRHPLDTTRRGLETAASIARAVRPLVSTRSPVMTERRLGWHYDALDVPLDDLKRSAKAAGCTLNDAFVAGVAGGLRRYHEHYGVSCDELRVTLPISIRDEDDPVAGNRITLMRFPVPTRIADPLERMRAIHEVAGHARAEPSVPLANSIAAALNLLPSGLIGGMLKHVDFLASNVPGLPMPLYIGDARLERFYPFGPTIGAALNVTLLSYNATCGIGINTDTGAVEDPDVLTECLRADFEEILDLIEDHGPVTVATRA